MHGGSLPPPKERVETRPVAVEPEDHRTVIVSQTLTSHHMEEPKKFVRENIREREREVGKRRKKVEDKRTHRLIVHTTTPARSSTPAPSSTQ